MSVLPVVAEGAKLLVSLPVMYTLQSLNEYIAHRYYQHEELRDYPKLLGAVEAAGVKLRGNGHVEHHAETYDDMTLKDDARWRRSPAALRLDEDVYRGTAINWAVMFQVIAPLCVLSLPIYVGVMKFSVIGTVLLACFLALTEALIWNALHPDMHGLPEVPVTVGPPSRFLARFRGSAYFQWLYRNHEGHHILGGRGNYNVAYPLMDHVLGTYVSPAEWRPRTRPTKRPEAVAVSGEVVAPA